MIVIIEQSRRNSIMPASARACLLGASILIGGASAASAQQTAPQPAHPDATVTTPAPGGDAEGAKPAGKLVLLFDTGDAELDTRNEAILDHASRLYREGRPIIMIVSGSTDAVGSPSKNLLLSLRRATTVAQGLLVRGIPAERTQILAKGETNPAVSTERGVAEAQNRRVEITWR
jgi:outer membrane protein OmpA-like peptidoglycan-associated protein